MNNTNKELDDFKKVARIFTIRNSIILNFILIGINLLFNLSYLSITVTITLFCLNILLIQIGINIKNHNSEIDEKLYRLENIYKHHMSHDDYLKEKEKLEGQKRGVL